MKTYHPLLLLLFLTSVLFFSGCSEDSPEPEEEVKEIEVSFSEFEVEPWTYSASLTSAEIIITGEEEYEEGDIDQGFIYDYASKDTLLIGQGLELYATEPVVKSKEYELATQPDSLYSIRSFVVNNKTGKVFYGPIQQFKTLKLVEVFFIVTNSGTKLSVSGTITNRTGKEIDEADLVVIKGPTPVSFVLDLTLQPDNTFEYTHNNLLVSGAHYYAYATVVIDGDFYMGGHVNFSN